MTKFGKTLIFIVVLVILAVGTLLFKNKTPKENTTGDSTVKETVSLCYYYFKITPRDFYDRAWLRLNINDTTVNGEFRNYPAEKDSKIGIFNGTITARDASGNRTAALWWDSLAEGMQVKEELIIDLSDTTAHVNFGEMVDRGDGVYVYKDKTTLMFGPTLPQISCDELDEILKVEEHLRANISAIASGTPVLGGTWYVVGAHVDKSSHGGTVIYEDGHIQSTATFEYTYDSITKAVIIKNFQVK